VRTRPARVRRATPAVIAAVVAVALTAPAAHAGPLVASATSCSAQVFEQPFLRWVDPATYVLVPSGTLEQSSGSAWKLTGKAARSAGNETFYVHRAGEAWGLSLPSGSSATSGSMCVGIEHPTLRFFARSASALATLKVEVLFEDATGTVRTLTIGVMPATSSWQPSVLMPVTANLLALLPGQYTAVAFRFTPQGGDWRIDDVYVDPHQSR
jgi:hypothetical protein